MSDNPFLLPPGGARPPAASPAVAPPAVAPPVPDPAHYIAIPASVESATHRIVRPPQEPVAEKPVAEEPVAEEAAAAEPVAQEPVAEEPVAEETRVAPPAAEGGVPPARQTQLILVLPDGARLPLDGAVLLGRDPAGIPEHPGARLLAVSDPGKTVSKTHALLERDPTGRSVRVHDLFSTNGVAVDTAESRTLVPPGGLADAPVGSSILLGSFVIEVAVVDPDHA